jgi:RNA polymerase sigma factor (sigma-70 family)
MTAQAADSTCPTLLRRVAREPADEHAWREFVARYEPRIKSCCNAFPLQAADAEDVAQTILLKLVKGLRTFEYDPSRSFRAWLHTVAHHALVDFLDERRVSGLNDAAVTKMLESTPARESIAQEILAEFDRERLEIAIQQARQRVPRSQWEAFRLTVLEGLSGAEASATLGMPVATVYTAKSKVKKLVRELMGSGQAGS